MLSSWSRNYRSSKIWKLATSWCNSMSSMPWSMWQWICIEKSNMSTEWRSPTVKCFPQRWFSMWLGTPHSSIHFKSIILYIPDLYCCCHILYLNVWILNFIRWHSFMMMIAVLCDCNYTISCVTMILILWL